MRQRQQNVKEVERQGWGLGRGLDAALRERRKAYLKMAELAQPDDSVLAQFGISKSVFLSAPQMTLDDIPVRFTHSGDITIAQTDYQVSAPAFRIISNTAAGSTGINLDITEATTYTNLKIPAQLGSNEYVATLGKGWNLARYESNVASMIRGTSPLQLTFVDTTKNEIVRGPPIAGVPGGMTFAYTINTINTAEPSEKIGEGKIRLNQQTGIQSSSTKIFLRQTDLHSASVQNVLDVLNQVNGTQKGFLKVMDRLNPDKHLMFTITGVTSLVDASNESISTTSINVTPLYKLHMIRRHSFF